MSKRPFVWILLIGAMVVRGSLAQTSTTGAIAGVITIVAQPGSGWIAITEVRSGAYPPASLVHLDANALVTRLALRPGTPSLAYEGTTPLTCPWRVLIVGAERDRLMQSAILHSLTR